MQSSAVNGETLNIADSAGDNGDELGSGHNDLLSIVVGILDMRNAGTQLPLRTAAFIPR